MSLTRASIWTITALTVFLASCGGSALKSAPAPFSRENTPHHLAQMDATRAREQMPERIYEKEGWQLVVFVTNKGSRSQGIHGDLYYNGQKVDGKRGQTLTTPLGEIFYHGSEMERANLWDTTGWTISGKSGFFTLPTPASESDNAPAKTPAMEFGIG